MPARVVLTIVSDLMRRRMQKKDLALLMLSLADGGAHTPVQIQKALFLATKNVPELVNDGPGYRFVPYDYGPFDKTVYSDLIELRRDGLVLTETSQTGRWRPRELCHCPCWCASGHCISFHQEPTISRTSKSVFTGLLRFHIRSSGGSGSPGKTRLCHREADRR